MPPFTNLLYLRRTSIHVVVNSQLSSLTLSAVQRDLLRGSAEQKGECAKGKKGDNALTQPKDVE